jgi:hypothetical protein
LLVLAAAALAAAGAFLVRMKLNILKRLSEKRI